MDDHRPPTYFIDIDGTLLLHCGSVQTQVSVEARPRVLEGVMEFLEKADREGAVIVLCTGRRESARSITEKQLAYLCIVYDQLIMGCGGGPRYLINDRKEDGTETAFAINLDRNKGLAQCLSQK